MCSCEDYSQFMTDLNTSSAFTEGQGTYFWLCTRLLKDYS